MFSRVFKFNARSIAAVLKILRNLHYVGFKFNHKFKVKVSARLKFRKPLFYLPLARSLAEALSRQPLAAARFFG